MNDADAYTLHMTIAGAALDQAKYCRDARLFEGAFRWCATARHNLAWAGKCVAAMQAREIATRTLKPLRARVTMRGSGYSSRPVVVFSGGGGNGASAGMLVQRKARS